MFKRILTSILTFFLVTVIIFGLFLLMPQDPIEAKLGDNPDPAYEAALRYKYGYTLSPEIGAERISDAQRYVNWISGFFRGDLGLSIRYDQPVWTLLSARLPNTVTLALMAFVIDVLFGTVLGVFVAWLADTRSGLGTAVNAFTQIGIALPVFFASVLVILVLCIKWHWLPVQGFVPRSAGLGPYLKGLLLPTISISIGGIALITRYVRSAVSKELHSDYVLTARNKGVSEGKILFKHVLRNALVPVLTILGMHLVSIVTGSIVIEQVFGVPGVGTLLIAGVKTGDSILVMGVSTYIAAVVIIAYLVLDLLYRAADPRIRKE